MIHIVENHLEPRTRRLLETMFSDRKRLFVDLFGWDVPVVDGRLEIDQFDGLGTVYIICADAAGEHEASIRLMPTTRPHMLGEIFPHLCPRGVPSPRDLRTRFAAWVSAAISSALCSAS